LYAGDLNAIQDQYADLTNLAQALSIASVAVGESGLIISRFGTGVLGIAGTLRVTSVINAIAGFQVNGVALASTHLSDSAALARLASPAFTGTPTAPTVAVGDNSQSIATTAWVKSQGYTGTTNVNLTGTPTAATAPVDTNTAQLATCAFVIGQAGATTPAMDGTATVGTSTRFARADHIHPTDTSRAPLASPGLTGAPTAPTPAATDVSTAIATTAFVRSILPAGIMAPYGGAAAPGGWLICDGTAISRTTYAALFAAISTTFGAGDGSTTFNLPDMRGRHAVGKNAATFATLGGTGGAETVVLTNAQMPIHSHSGVSGGSGTLTTGNDSPGHTHTFTTGTESADHTHSGTTGGRSVGHTHRMTDASWDFGTRTDATMTGTQRAVTDIGGRTGAVVTGGTYNVTTGGESTDHAHSFSTGGRSAAHTHSGTTDGENVNHTHTIASHTHTIANDGGGAAHGNLAPYLVVNYIIKT
jgi:microcystin-dependent protein